MNDFRYKSIRHGALKWKNYSFDLGQRTYIMGILNVTPDSFSDGGEFDSVSAAMRQAYRMIEEGADIVDVGGESTRPGSDPVGVEEEIYRVVPVIEAYKKLYNIPLSLDTSKELVGLRGLEAGADMINDVWGFQREPGLAEVTASFGVPAVLMHNQNGTEYAGDIIDEIKRFFEISVDIATQAGVKEELIVLDPGIGFGKTQQHNRDVLARLGEFNSLGFPLLLGTSRKSIIGTILNLPPKERLEGTLATSTMGILAGADFLRVHDVKENLRVSRVTDKIVRL